MLWGDVIRGCYRRSVDGVASPTCLYEDDDDDDDQNAYIGIPQAEIDDDQDHITSPPPPRRPAKERGIRITGVQAQKAIRASRLEKESSGEFFDLDEVSSSSDDDQPHLPAPQVSPRRGRPPKKLDVHEQADLVVPRQSIVVDKGKKKQQTVGRSPGRPRAVSAPRKEESEGEWFDLDGISSSGESVIGNYAALPDQNRSFAMTVDLREQQLSAVVRNQSRGGYVRQQEAKSGMTVEPSSRKSTAETQPRGKGKGLVLKDGEVDYFVEHDSETVSQGPGRHSPEILTGAMSLLSLGSPSLSVIWPRKKPMEFIDLSD